MRIKDVASITASSAPEPVTRLRSYGAVHAAPAARAVDSATIVGIPEAEMTPKVRAAIMTLMQEVDVLRRQLSEASERMAELEKLADSDPLLDIYNRRAFVRELGRTMAGVERHGERATLVYLDLNGMKQVNDVHGHSAGDAVLEHVGRLIAGAIRDTDALGRLGGDEFGVLLANTDPMMADMKARQLADIVFSRPLNWRGKPIGVSVAYGVFPLLKGQTINETLEKADEAMYRRKRGEKAVRL